MPDQAVGLYDGDALKRYAFGDDHPFGPDRLDAFRAELDRRGLRERVRLLEPVAAPEEVLRRFHSDAYVALLRERSRTGGGYLDCGDTPAYPGILEAALVVVGTTLDAVHRVVTGELRRAFIPIAGLHHARRNSASGFCAVNDVGVAIETLRSRYGVRRIAYVDIDAHHGDGVYYEFESDPDLCFADLHEDGRFLYPGTGFAHETGRGAAAGTKLNLPMPPHAGDEEFLAVWPRVEALIERAAPEIILFQCGADSVAGDPITHLRYTRAAHAHAAARLCRAADAFCQGRIVGMGGGGYNRANLGLAWTAALESFIQATAARER